jgi:putative ABC transport system permease protein
MSLWQDVVFAMRVYRRQPGILGTTIAGLALAIGLSTAAFTVTSAATAHRYGVADSSEVVHVGSPEQATPWSYPDYLRLREIASSLKLTAQFFGTGGGTFRTAADAERENLPTVRVLSVSGNYFDVLGGRALLGRALAPDDDAAGTARVIVLSHWFWTSQLAADPLIVGRSLWINDQRIDVIGVMERGFLGLGENGSLAGWTSLGAYFEMARESQAAERLHAQAKLDALRARIDLSTADRERMQRLSIEATTSRPLFDYVEVIGRLEPGLTRVHAEADLNVAADVVRLQRGTPGPEGKPPFRLSGIDELKGSERARIGSLTTLVALLMLLACANVTNLLLASATARRHEIATRLALGASRARIRRQLLTESLLLGCLAGLAGFGLALWLIPTLGVFLYLSPTTDLSMRLPIYLFTVLVTLVASVAAGLAPARQSGRGDLVSSLKADKLAAPGRIASSKLRSLLIAAQGAAAIILLVFAALYARALVRASMLDLGADVDRLVNVSVEFSSRHDDALRWSYVQAAQERLRGLPGVAAASRVLFPLFGDGGARSSFLWNKTDAEYFTTVGARVVRGRTYSRDEVTSAAHVAVISENLARRFWQDDDPIGSSLERVWGRDDPVGATLENWTAKPAGTRIIGVVNETTTSLFHAGVPTVFVPMPQATEGRAQFVVRTADDSDPSAVIRSVHDALRRLDATVSRRVAPALAKFESELDGPRISAATGALLGISALLLALMGLFGVTAFAVVMRRHEVAVRLALGATGGRVIRMLLQDNLRPVVTGLAGGLFICEPAIRSVRHFVPGSLFGIGDRDPIAIAIGVVVLLAAGTIAVLVPARHAARVAPAEVLKTT